MNRNELIDYIRDPASLTSDHLNQLEEIVAEAPYFQSARLLLAKGSAILNEPATKKRVSSAAIYATDRPLLKKYISGNLLFLTKPPSQKAEIPGTESAKTAGGSKNTQPEEAKESADSPSQATADTNQEKDGSALTTVAPTEDKLFIPGIPVGALDAILDELEQDMEDLKFSRSKFADLQEQLEDEGDASTPVKESEEQVTPEAPTGSDETQEVLAEEISTEEIPEASVESNDSDSIEATVEEEKTGVPELPVDQLGTDTEKADDLADSQTEETETADPIEESAPQEEKKSATEEEEDEIEKAIAEKLKNLQKQEPQKIEKEETPDTDTPETEILPGVDQIREVKLESDIRREQRMEKRLEREKRLSNLNKLSATSIKKLEDQMWGDSDEDVDKGTEKKKSEKIEDKATTSNKSDSKKSDSSPESSTSKTDPPKQSSAKEASAGESSKKDTEQDEVETPIKKPAAKKSATKKPVAKKAVVRKTEAKKTEVKKTEVKKTEVKKTTAKKSVAKKAGTSKASATKKPTTKKTSAAKATAARKPSTKGTTKKSSTKKASPKKKSDDDGKSDRPKKQDKLIEKFISENPSISKGAKKPKSDGDLSTKSSTWNKELASEYLAEIYLNQGNQKRAIEIYKVLSLKFPQKKSYFADLISKIK
ncbi:MAG: hypothetical protein ABJG78_01905 [Cyclobacteriaceae bacterium]